ncbi:hypothetical protein J6590_054840 [Homalodisca vitripennis]|nr:hypothetical protein J6590_054840 [Homalodisca vitripennis]
MASAFGFIESFGVLALQTQWQIQKLDYNKINSGPEPIRFMMELCEEWINTNDSGSQIRPHLVYSNLEVQIERRPLKAICNITDVFMKLFLRERS